MPGDDAAGTFVRVAPACRSGQAALVCGDSHLSWGDLHRQVDALALTLHHRTRPGQAIALDLRQPLQLVVAFLGVVRAGCRALVFDPQWTAAQRQAIEQQVQIDLMLDDAGYAALEQAALCKNPSPADLPVPSAQDLFYVGFTSGSTGLPKGYRRQHASWLASFRISDRMFDLTQEDVVMAPGSLATSLHLYGVVHALARGIPAVLVPQFRPRSVLAAMRARNVTVCYGTPTQIRLLAQTLDRDKSPPLTALRHLIVSGAKWPEDTREALRRHFPAARLTEFYGTSETSFVTLHSDRDRAPLGSVGRPVPGVEVCIGPTPEAPVADGERGRIWVRSPLLFDGYECGGGDEIRRHGDWLTVGDHGWQDAAGHLYLVGREKRMLVSSGQNLYPEEMETWLQQMAGIEQAAVLGVQDELRGQRLVALYQTSAETASEQLRKHCAQRYPTAQLPRAWHQVSEWPLTRSGKSDFVRLQALADQLEAAHE
ncbi:AMP-dependent synthetase [Natronospirillum operosum]|uniref:AMP-dependent synthetase n=1 Tax=Natronospirillum operosum TaxID=2759953 RepID=A0A4Z0W8Y9_9GAMM|nr:AMP-binding protein [Natronospirillum operosum]TGG91568.1 AMP-dependent synthetase [Natronospirillum operosum]